VGPSGTASVETLARACALVCGVFDAEEAYVLRSGDPHFVRVDAPGDPTTYEIKQKGYFLVWRELAANPDLVGGLFSVADRLVSDPAPLQVDTPATHLALLLPSDESSSELLVIRGPWPAGLTGEQAHFLEAARPMLACLVGALLDTRRRERQVEQLLSLGTVAGALTRGQDLETALPAIAMAIAKASGFDFTTLTLFDESLERITGRAVNNARHSETGIATYFRDSALLRDRAIVTARRLSETRRPVLYSKSSTPDHEHPLGDEIERSLERAHILSLATFPLWSGERLSGTLNFSDSTAHAFEPAEVEFLTQLCEQAAMAVECLELHRELREANAALARAASYDALTGLPNRTLFLDRLGQAFARAERSDGSVAVLFADLDNFKVVNDSLGHEIGDRLLQVAAERLQQHLRASDVAARLGGDEFTVLLEDVTGEPEAAQVADRLHAALQQPVEIDGHQLLPNASIGIACAEAANVSAESLLRKADLAMYQAKARGKARATCYDESMNTAAVQRLTLEAEVRQAIAAEQFTVHYQPNVALASQRVVELEALVR
jgi:diguanylate cyclase (GGDEF)-like protein